MRAGNLSHVLLSLVAPVLPVALSSCEVIRPDPDPAVVTDADLRRRIEATGLAWHVRHKVAGIEFLLVPPGESMRGASTEDGEAWRQEKPAHRVRITKPFYLGRYEMTQGEWKRATEGSNPSHWKASDRHPLEQVSHSAVTEVGRTLGCRLPTEAEWEYACRAGTTATRYGNLDDISWHRGISGGAARREIPRAPRRVMVRPARRLPHLDSAQAGARRTVPQWRCPPGPGPVMTPRLRRVSEAGFA